jgi:site-specific DNA-methyltransferase (adenine-specific)
VNKLLFGDNLTWLRDAKLFPDASVDLVYLDPPFNSNADYNVLFREASGEASQAQFHAFTDTWNWADAAQTYAEFVDNCPNTAVVEMVEALHQFLKNSPMMAYLAMMAPRLVELHRVLKPTGSLYLHCDPTASHYLRMLLDGIFGAENFRNEIIWRRTGSHNSSKRFGPIHDTIFFYSKSDEYVFNKTYRPYLKGHVDAYFKQEDAKGKFWTNALTGAGTRNGESGKPWKGFNPTSVGRHWALPGRVIRELGIDENLSVQEKLDALDAAGFIGKTQIGSSAMPTYKQYLNQSPGMPLQDIWAYQPYTQGLLANSEEAIDEDVRWLVAQGDTERMGYATQKPQALLERILTAASKPGDIVLDPFCGCGTTIHAAQKLGRQWIGIDVTYLAINLIKRRLKDAFGADAQFEERGQPTDFGSAKALAELDKWQFQQWALSLIDARPRTEGDGKGADRGVDGMLYFYEGKDKREKILVQVKGGGVQRNDVSTLLGDVNNQKFAAGILITLEKPTKPMREEAADAGRYESKLWHDKDYPKIQILTIEGLLSGKERVEAPPQMNPFAKAQREGKAEKQTDFI